MNCRLWASTNPQSSIRASVSQCLPSISILAQYQSAEECHELPWHSAKSHQLRNCPDEHDVLSDDSPSSTSPLVRIFSEATLTWFRSSLINMHLDKLSWGREVNEGGPLQVRNEMWQNNSAKCFILYIISPHRTSGVHIKHHKSDHLGLPYDYCSCIPQAPVEEMFPFIVRK